VKKSNLNANKLTILFATGGGIATKRWDKIEGKTEKTDFNAGYLYKHMSQDVSNILELSACLTALEKIPIALVIRGALLPDKDANKDMRRQGVNFQTPWYGLEFALFDFDHIRLPPNLSLKMNLRAVLDYLVNLLPAEFHDASYHWQLSSSAGMGSDTEVSMHLWFWFDRHITNGELKEWGKAVNEAAGFKLIDTALFNDVQAHYTAAPIFGVGVENPFPVRSGLIEKSRHEVSLRLLTQPPSTKLRSQNTTGAGCKSIDNDGGGFEHFLSLIGDHEGGEGFHEPILQAAASYVATHCAEDVDVQALYEIIHARVLAADSSRHSTSVINERASRKHITSAIEGAIKKYGQASPTSARRKPRTHTGISPHYQAKTVSVAEAQSRLARIVETSF
jgi:hypothetical protein